VARLIAVEAQGPKLVVEKSTVPAQTGRQLERALRFYRGKTGFEFRVASNPEFLREGTAVEDFLHPDRIVIGVEDSAAEAMLGEIYRPILEHKRSCPVHGNRCRQTGDVKFVVTTVNSAELIKHACNSFLAMKISYANMIADLCEKVDADIDEVARTMGMDPRIGPAFLNAGLGFGGFCLPKDVQAFIRLADRCGVDSGLLREVERVNKRRVDQFLEKMNRALWVVKDKRVGVLGLAFKPHTDDVRFAPSLEVVRRLLADGAEVRAYDEQAMPKVSALFPKLACQRTPYEVAQNADALLILTESDTYRKLDWRRIYEVMARPLVIDGRNLLDPALMDKIGFEYHSFGRRRQSPVLVAMPDRATEPHLTVSEAPLVS
jgi:UDPglucose 6-dehydrogenase